MSDSEEKFFEDLARFGSASEGAPYRAELAKASHAPTRIKVQTPRVEEEEEAEPQAMYVNEPEGQLTIDVYQTPDDIVVESAIAGVKPDDIDIQVSSDSITIRGERRRDTRIKDEDYFYQECYWGRFSRSVILPQEIDPDSAAVSFKNGVLTVKLPKLNRKKTRKLKVKLD